MNLERPDLEIVVVSGESYYTHGDSPSAIWDAIIRGDSLICFWFRNDGIRFEEEFRFAEEAIRLVRTNRT